MRENRRNQTEKTTADNSALLRTVRRRENVKTDLLRTVPIGLGPLVQNPLRKEKQKRSR